MGDELLKRQQGHSYFYLNALPSHPPPTPNSTYYISSSITYFCAPQAVAPMSLQSTGILLNGLEESLPILAPFLLMTMMAMIIPDKVPPAFMTWSSWGVSLPMVKAEIQSSINTTKSFHLLLRGHKSESINQTILGQA